MEGPENAGHASSASAPDASREVFHQAETSLEQRRDVAIGEVVVNPPAVATLGQDSTVDQPLELIGDCLRLHTNGAREVGHAEFAITHQGVQQTDPRVACEDLE